MSHHIFRSETKKRGSSGDPKKSLFSVYKSFKNFISPRATDAAENQPEKQDAGANADDNLPRVENETLTRGDAGLSDDDPSRVRAEEEPRDVPPPPLYETDPQASVCAFHQNLETLHRRYGFYPEVGRVYYEWRYLREIISDDRITSADKIRAFGRFRDILNREIEKLEADERDPNPGRLDRVLELKKLRNILDALAF